MTMIPAGTSQFHFSGWLCCPKCNGAWSVVVKMKVLFVCMGNICRSPTAEGVLRHKLALRGMSKAVEVASAGTHAHHVGAVHGFGRRAIGIEGDG